MGDSFKKISDERIQQKVDNILSEPMGTPINLTREEAIAIVEAGRGSRPNLPSGKDYVKSISKVWRWMLPRD